MSSSGSSRYPHWPWNGSRPTGVSPHAASAHSSCTCRTPTRPCTKASLQRNKALVSTSLFLPLCLRLSQFLDLSADVKAAHSLDIPQRSPFVDALATSDYTPLPDEDFLGPDSGTYQSAFISNNLTPTRGCLDDPHGLLMSIPAGYFGSL